MGSVSGMNDFIQQIPLLHDVSLSSSLNMANDWLKILEPIRKLFSTGSSFLGSSK